MERCQITFSSNKVEKLLTEEFAKVNKNRECFRRDCDLFGKCLPKDIEVIKSEAVPGIEGMTEMSVDLEPSKNGKPRKILKFNDDGSFDFFMIGGAGKLQSDSKRLQDETKRVQKLVESTQCQHCDIINNFAKYGEEICRRNGLSYMFVVNDTSLDGTMVVSIMSSEGDFCKRNGEEVKTGCFENFEMTVDNYRKKIKEFSKMDFDVLITCVVRKPMSHNYGSKMKAGKRRWGGFAS